MSASEHLHPELFHGTHNPNWRQNPGWIHAGSVAQANDRLDYWSSQINVPVGEFGEPTIHQIELHPEATIYPRVIPAKENERGGWDDLGTRIDEGDDPLSHPAYSHPSGKRYDVYPYENTWEGSEGDTTSYVVNPKAIKKTKTV